MKCFVRMPCYYFLCTCIFFSVIEYRNIVCIGVSLHPQKHILSFPSSLLNPWALNISYFGLFFYVKTATSFLEKVTNSSPSNPPLKIENLSSLPFWNFWLEVQPPQAESWGFVHTVWKWLVNFLSVLPCRSSMIL